MSKIEVYNLDIIFNSGLVKTILTLEEHVADRIQEDFKKQQTGVKTYQDNIHLKHTDISAIVCIKNGRGQEENGGK